MDINKSIKPIVSVRLMTYNHEDYIRQCMQGVLNQKTNFKIEIVIGDDFSTDNTLGIIKEFSDTKNVKIRVLKRPVNGDYWKKRKLNGRLYNFSNIIENCRGKYIAILDGDDYWIDPNKLQKQVDFLEQHSDYGLVHTNCDLLHEVNNELEKKIHSKFNIQITNGSIFNDLLIRNFIKTPTVLFRKDFIPDYIFQFSIGDYPLILEISNKTKIGYINDSTAVYRKRINSMSNFNDLQKQFNFKKEVHKIKLFFINKHGCNDKTSRKIENDYNQSCFEYAYRLKDSNLASKLFLKLNDEQRKKFLNKTKLWATKNKILWMFTQNYFRIKNKWTRLKMNKAW